MKTEAPATLGRRESWTEPAAPMMDPRHRKRAVAAAARVIACGLWVLVATHASADPAYDEAKVKAAFVERFIHFVDWPEARLADSSRPFVIGILGRDPIQPHLEELLASKQLKDRAVQIRLIERVEDLGECHVLWISSSEAGHVADVLARIDGQAVLTMSDTEGLAARGVDINLSRAGDHLGFEVNRVAAEHSGLQLSAKLLDLARIVSGP